MNGEGELITLVTDEPVELSFEGEATSVWRRWFRNGVW